MVTKGTAAAGTVTTGIVIKARWLAERRMVTNIAVTKGMAAGRAVHGN